MNNIRIVVADDQMLTREGLRTILELEDDMEVVGMARNGEEACRLTEELLPDLVLMDIQMPKMDGLTALKYVKQACPQTLVIILTTFIEEDYIFEGMAVGANGYMLKDMDGDKIIAAIRDAMSGQYILPAQVAAKMAERVARLNEEFGVWLNVAQDKLERVKLTDREKEIARLIIQGYKNREIADALQVAEGTVRNYVSQLYGKLGVDGRLQAIASLHKLV